MELDDAMVDPEFDESSKGYRNENVQVKVGELETYLLCPTDVESIIDGLAWKACDHEGRKRFVSVRTKERILVANVRPHAMLRRRQGEEYQELHEIIEYINEKQEMTLVHDGTKATAHERSSRGSPGKVLAGDQGLGWRKLSCLRRSRR